MRGRLPGAEDLRQSLTASRAFGHGWRRIPGRGRRAGRLARQSDFLRRLPLRGDAGGRTMRVRPRLRDGSARAPDRPVLRRQSCACRAASGPSLFRGAHARGALRFALPADGAPERPGAGRACDGGASAAARPARPPDEGSRAQGAHRPRPAPLGRGAGEPVRRSGIFRAARGGAAGGTGAAGAADRRPRSDGAARGRVARPGLCAAEHDRRSGPAGQDRGGRAAAGGTARAHGRGRGFRVRFVCAERLPPALLGALVDDEDEVVREAALARKTAENA